MKSMMRKFLNKMNPYKTVPASEAFAGRPLVRSNVPGEYLMSGVSHRHRKMTDSEYREKSFRKENNIRNSMDILEEKILNSSRTIIHSYYNYPHKIIPILNKEDHEYRRKVEKLNHLINSILPEHERIHFENTQNSKYDKYTVSGMSLTKSHEKKIDSLISALTEELDLLNETMKYEIYDEIPIRLKQVNSNICKMLSKSDFEVEERIEFYGDV